MQLYVGALWEDSIFVFGERISEGPRMFGEGVIHENRDIIAPFVYYIFLLSAHKDPKSADFANG